MPFVPKMSKPALQNAEIEWKIDIQIPFAPKFLQKTGIIETAPTASIINVPVMMNFVSLTIPPTFGAEIASCIVLRCIRDILLPASIENDAAIVTTPSPPICMRVRMTD